MKSKIMVILLALYISFSCSPAESTAVQAAPGTVVKLSPEKAVLVNGKTFFPICVWQQPKYFFDYDKYLGVNTILCPPQGEDKKWYMDAAREKGLYVITSYSEEFKNHPAVIGWMLWAETPEDSKKIFKEMKEKDPDRLIYIHLGWDEIINFKPEQQKGYEDLFENADLTCCHVFPLGKNNPDGLHMVGDVVDFMNKYSKNKIAPIIDLECAKLEKGERKGSTPSREQVRCEIWEAIVHGAKGLCYFTISFEPFVWSQIPARNEDALRYNNGLIQELKDVILLGKDDVKLERSAENNLELNIMAKRVDKDIYLFVVNTANREGKVRIALDKQYVIKNIVNYEEQGDKPKLKDNVLEEQYNKYQVRIYKLQIE